MKSFGNVAAQDYVIDSFSANSRLGWAFVSSSTGVQLTNPEGLNGAVTITRATNDAVAYYDDVDTAPKNIETDIYEYVLYRSISHNFYKNRTFWNGQSVTSSVEPPDNSYVISVSSEMYGERITPNTFQFRIDNIPTLVLDDGYGNLKVGNIIVGNIFYDYGIGIITHDILSEESSVTTDGIKIVSGSEINLSYETEFKIYRHEISVKLKPAEFNFSIANPSISSTYEAEGEIAQEFEELNIPSSGSNNYRLYQLMQAGVLKPYVTTIGLYNDRYELLAVAKLSTPIQRTFDTDQIFIVRFDV
jgi:hypothetical protein